MDIEKSYPITIDIIWGEMGIGEQGIGKGNLTIHSNDQGTAEYELWLKITNENGESVAKCESDNTLQRLVSAMAENPDYCSIKENEIWAGLLAVPEISKLINKENKQSRS